MNQMSATNTYKQLKQVFLKPARQKAKDHRSREAVEFRAKQLYPMLEIARIDILATRKNEVLTTVAARSFAPAS